MQDHHLSTLFTLALSVLFALGITAQDKQISLLPGNDVIELSPDLSSMTVPVTVKLTNVERENLAIAIVQVKVGERLDKRLLDAFQVSQQLSAQNQFEVTIDLDVINSPDAEYKVLFQVRDTSSTSPVDLEITFKHPQAVIESTTKLVVTNTKKPWAKADPVRDLHVFLHETNGKARLHNASLTPLNFTGPANEVLDVTITLPIPDTANLSADGIAYVPINLRGNFPLGTTNGIVEFDAPQMAQPLQIPMEIKTRLGYAWLWVFLIIGLILGWFVKKYLKSQADLSQAQLEAVELLKEIQEALATSPDTTFQDHVKPHASALRTALQNNVTSEITEATTDASQAFTTASADLETSTQALYAQLDTLTAITASGLRLPLMIATTMEKRNQQVQAVITDAGKGHVTGSAVAAQKLAHLLNIDLRNLTLQWKSQFGSRLQVPDDLLPATVGSVFAEQVASIKPHLNALAVELDEDPAKMTEALKKLDVIMTAVINLNNRLLEAMRTEGTRTVLELNRIRSPRDAAAIKAFQQLHAQYISSAQEHFNAPEAMFDMLTNQSTLIQLTEAWEASILNQDDSAQALVDARKYGEAAAETRTVANKGRTTADTDGRVSRDYPPTLLAETAVPEDAYTLTPAPEVEPSRDTHIPLVDKLLPMLFSRGTSVNRLDESTIRARRRRIKNIQTGVSYVLILAVGYGLYHENFTGSMSNVVAILLWAFALDITIDKVTEEAKKLTA
ncbi:MAG: hypothetical protein R3330_02050 [Saprospiraceae bacterium]|nr:hypothetical protein [Saprospiraceae bacterium]